MGQKKKSKLCGSCEGVVDLDVIICPYCGSDVLEILEDPYEKEQYIKDGKKELSLNETLSSLYPPPYKIDEVNEEKEDLKKEKIEKKDKKKSLLFPFLSFSLGINLLFFSLFLVTFSQNGELFLKWNTSYWFVYALAGFPLLLLGNKFLTSFFKK